MSPSPETPIKEEPCSSRDPASWSEVGGGVDDRVMDLIVYGGELIVGGRFTSVGSTPVEGLARWNGTNWDTLPNPEPGYRPWIFDMAVDGTDLIVAGYMQAIGNVARWDGTAWSYFAGGPNYDVLAVEAYNSRVYVGGTFTEVGGETIANLAEWDGSAWLTLAAGTDLGVEAMARYQGSLVIAGYFTGPGAGHSDGSGSDVAA